MKDINFDDELAALLAADVASQDARQTVSERLDALVDASAARAAAAETSLHSARLKFEASPSTASATAKLVAEQVAANAAKAHAELSAKLTPVTHRLRVAEYLELKATVTRVDLSDLMDGVKVALSALDAAWRQCLAEGNERIEKHRNLVRRLNALRPEQDPPMPLGVGQHEFENQVGALFAKSSWARL